MSGYVRAWRSLVDWEWYKDTNTKCLFLHLLLTANHAEARWEGIPIKPGQLITSSSSLAKAIGLSRQNVRTSLTKLKSTSEITIKSTNQYILVTIVNWEFYQSDAPLLTSETTTDSTSDQPATNQRLTTNKKNKKDKKEKHTTNMGKTPYGSQNNVMLTEGEISKLRDEFEDLADEAVEFLSSYIVEKDYQSESHYLAIRRWVIGAVKEQRLKESRLNGTQLQKKGGSMLDGIPMPVKKTGQS